MHFFNAIRRTIENGLETAVTTVGAIFRTHSIGIVNQARRPEEDIEMSAFGHDDDGNSFDSLINNTTGNEYARNLRAWLSQFSFSFHPFGSIRIPFIRRPFSRIAKVIRILSRFRMPSLHRPQFIRRLVHPLDNQVEKPVWVLISVMVLWMLLQHLGFGLLLKPLGLSTYELTLHNLNQLRDVIPIWNEPKHDHSLFEFPDQEYSPGAVFLVTDLEAISDIPPITTVTSELPASPGQDIAKNIPEATVNFNTLLADRHSYRRTLSDDDDAGGPFHDAYPLHAGRVDKRPQALRIKTQLERCAELLLTKLKGQGLEVTPNFEFALHHCKSVIDFSLDTLYGPKKVSVPKGPATEAAATKTKQPPKRSRMFHGVVPGRHQISPATKHVSRGFNDCATGFCDWVSTGNLDRCYHRNEQQSQEKGHPVYSNDSIDDFMDTAPLECNLCLPEPDEEGIKEYCKEVGITEYVVLMRLVCFVAVVGSTVFLLWLVEHGLGRRPRRHVHFRGPQF